MSIEEQLKLAEEEIAAYEEDLQYLDGEDISDE
ncbi:hypothetical protein [Burkholderia phage vB_BpP_HN01]|uniref:Uncharacterized protein n=1 Tax=Burkholderia phage vB_BpP_HN02 TaxID=3116925 RepID=A0AAX4JI07_9CAUD|nr:hypothetical protein [Burkholderia phage vB_BpP_HN01]